MASARHLISPLVSPRAQVLRGAFWVFCGRALASTSGLFVLAILTRRLSPADTGTYMLMFSSALILGSLSTLGLKATLVREVAQSMAQNRPGRAKAAVLSGLAWGGLGACLIALGLALGGCGWISNRLFHDATMAALGPWLALWSLGLALQYLASEAFRGLQDVRAASLLGDSLSRFLFLAPLAWLFLGGVGLDVTLVSGLAALAALMGAFVALAFLWKRLRGWPSRGRDRAPAMMSAALPLFMSEMSVLLQGQIGLWLLAAYRPKGEVALYGSALRLAGYVLIPMTLLVGVVTPLIAGLYARQEHIRLQRALRSAASYMALMGLPLVLVFALAGEWLLGTFLSAYYSAAAPALTWLALGHFINLSTGFCGQLMTMTGHQTTYMVLVVSCGILTLGLQAWAAIHGDFRTMALVSAVGHSILNLLLSAAARWKTGLWCLPTLSPIPPRAG